MELQPNLEVSAASSRWGEAQVARGPQSVF